MGRRIDGLALRALLISGAYLLFVNAWHSVPLACALALACAAGAEILLRGRRRRRGIPAQARLLALARLDEAEAKVLLAPRLQRRDAGREAALCLALKHPSAALTAGDVLAAWKDHRGEARIALAATCPADAEARAFARALTLPAVALLDGPEVASLLSDWEPDDPGAPLPRPRLRERLLAALQRPVPSKLAILGPAMLALYLLHGQAAYLFAGLWICFRWISGRICLN